MAPVCAIGMSKKCVAVAENWTTYIIYGALDKPTGKSSKTKEVKKTVRLYSHLLEIIRVLTSHFLIINLLTYRITRVSCRIVDICFCREIELM
jgi:hypothetical protein